MFCRTSVDLFSMNIPVKTETISCRKADSHSCFKTDSFSSRFFHVYNPPADVYFGRGDEILIKRAETKRITELKRRQNYYEQRLVLI